jgi:hypothetical protein
MPNVNNFQRSSDSIDFEQENHSRSIANIVNFNNVALNDQQARKYNEAKG